MNGYRIETGGHNTGVRIEDFRQPGASVELAPEQALSVLAQMSDTEGGEK